MDHMFCLHFKLSHRSWYTFWALPSTLGSIACPGHFVFSSKLRSVYTFQSVILSSTLEVFRAVFIIMPILKMKNL